MKTKLLKIMIITILFCLVGLSNFSIASALLMQPPLERSFSWFSSNRMCPFLTVPYLAKDTRVKPMALASLPLEYELHESIPRPFRPFFYVAADNWNMAIRKFVLERWDKILRDDVVRISSEINRSPIDNSWSDQKNVIYLVNEEHFQRASVEFTHSSNQLRDGDLFLPGISMYVFPEVIDDSLPFLPISETDMMIREELLTDLEFYRYNLIMNLRKLGVEEPLFDMSVEDLRDKVYFTLEDMTIEEYRSLTLRHLEDNRDVTNDINPNAMGGMNSIDLDREVERLRNMEPARVRFFKYKGIVDLLNVDMEMMETQSSVSLVTAIMHEIGHGFGLNHIPPRPDEPRPLMEEDIYATLSELTEPKEIDFYARWGMSCLYEDILSR